MRWTRPVSLLTAIACCVPLGAEDLVSDSPAKTNATDAAPVQIKDFSVKPMANLSYFGDTLTIDPKVLVGIGYDSNIFSTPNNPDSDGFYVGLVGATIRDRINDHNRLAIDGEFETDRYFDSNKNDQGDLTGGHLRGDYFWTDKQSDEIHAQGGYSKYRDPFVDTGETILSQTIDGSIYGTWNGVKARVVVGGGAVRTDYLEDGLTFKATNLNNDDYKGDIRIGLVQARESFYYVLAAFDDKQYDHKFDVVANPGGYNDSTGYTVALGIQTLLGTRTSAEVEAGIIARNYAKDFQNNPSYNDQNVYKPYGNVLLKWKWEEGSFIGARAFSTIDDSITANSSWIYGADLDGRYRLAARAAVFANVTGYHSVDDGHPVGIDAASRTTEVGELGVEYILRRGLITRVKGDYTHSSANDNVEAFNRFVGIWEIAAAF
jgi:hypothetical protein